MERLTPTQVKERIDAGANIVLLDVREPWEYDTCRIGGSRLMPMNRVPAEAGTLDRQSEIVVLCHHGMRSLQVAVWLERAGFERVANLEGGIDAWSCDVDPNVPRY